jgi:hypothetical protein
MPRRNAATALLRLPRSMYQVPCPITGTWKPLLPNFRCLTIASQYLRKHGRYIRHCERLAKQSSAPRKELDRSSLTLLAMTN